MSVCVFVFEGNITAFVRQIIQSLHSERIMCGCLFVGNEIIIRNEQVLKWELNSQC